MMIKIYFIVYQSRFTIRILTDDVRDFIIQTQVKFEQRRPVYIVVTNNHLLKLNWSLFFTSSTN